MNVLMVLLMVALTSPQSAEDVAADAIVAPPPAVEPASEETWPAGDEDAGYELYAESCRACHSGVIAPSLKGVYGRAIASAEGYSYSAGLAEKSGETWNEANLHEFLIDPSIFAPGSKMQKKLPDAQDRADIIAFLKALPE